MEHRQRSNFPKTKVFQPPGGPRAVPGPPSKLPRKLLRASLDSGVRVAGVPNLVLGIPESPKWLRSDLFGPPNACRDSKMAPVRGVPSRSGRFAVEVQCRRRRKLFCDLIENPFASPSLRSSVKTFFFGVGGSGRRPSRVCNFE